MVVYRHNFSEALAEGLYRLSREGGPINIKHLGLTRNQWDNFQKLRYWGLVCKTTKEGKRLAGTWEVTEKGISFLKGDIRIPARVLTYRGSPVAYEGRDISFEEAHAGYKTRPEYAEDATPWNMEMVTN